MTTSKTWSDARFTLGGVELPLSAVTVERAPIADAAPMRRTSGSYEASFSLPMLSTSLARLFHVDPPGASAATLARRVGYGGRKGRRALARLFARALPVDIATATTRLRGKAVALSPTEMVLRVRRAAS